MKMSAVAVVIVPCVGMTLGCSSPSSPSDTGGGTPTVPAPPSIPIIGSVSIRDSAYAPDPLYITIRGDVIWTNMGRSRHTTVSDAGLWNSGTLLPASVVRDPYKGGDPSDADTGSGESFTWIFSEAGIYPYHCEIHPYIRGTIYVSLDSTPGGTKGE